jgi:hypothetical protein
MYMPRVTSPKYVEGHAVGPLSLQAREESAAIEDRHTGGQDELWRSGHDYVAGGRAHLQPQVRAEARHAPQACTLDDAATVLLEVGGEAVHQLDRVELCLVPQPDAAAEGERDVGGARVGALSQHPDAANRCDSANVHRFTDCVDRPATGGA